MSRVKVSSKVPELADLASKIIAKNTTDGELSLLKDFPNFVSLQTRLAKMQEYEQKADEANRLKEEMNEQKNKEAKAVRKDIIQIRNLLKAHYPEDLKKLGGWGFTVDETTKAKIEEPA
ncbi:hypothetical protein [Marinifilum fragile]|uniref:hypothetical protein n=1 Tax=Marinifilum fragile TaxID=570161 RepID=UPI002AA7B386|nr:hypothetical protein [Marinifilum fragile]